MNESSAPRIDLNLFRVFEAIYRAGSLTRAAEELHLTQPAVSNALARLRSHYDDPLFVREGRKIAPTPLAHGIADEVAQALRTLRDSVQRAGHFDPAGSTRRFVIGMPESLEFTLLPRLVQALHAQAPQLRVHSVRIDRERLARQLVSGDLSLALDVPQPLGPRIRQQRVLKDRLVVAMRPGHPLAKTTLGTAGWLGARHVVVSGRSSGPTLEDVALSRRGLGREVALRCQNYYAACRIVAHSDLLLTLPQSHGEWLSRDLKLHLADAPIPLPALEIMMYWPEGAEADAGNRWLREHVGALSGSGAITAAKQKKARA
ncbi:LysR family transcriptional regulator [Lysobacter sp. CFH 32150]|uniref:LysR family transcriptional regulator n=1 Tax=Lysobacter sp. CFH 32150 TaxID=2927128 RepID=UPI001FA6DCF5|nr:LysR family transcriptional regulator [Lysobacter sp. CFH 32150]MCI4568806.1 LysR substrate-binding domain-containing protein [Lysobacter sp. CFH 32150]